jgi:hypothetical protein
MNINLLIQAKEEAIASTPMPDGTTPDRNDVYHSPKIYYYYYYRQFQLTHIQVHLFYDKQYAKSTAPEHDDEQRI